jgi:putative ABC transport system permease protein
MMGSLLSTLGEFLRDLRAQKLRTFLTVFGIVWGTVAIVVLLAFGMGFKKQLAVNMHGIGESIAIMFPGRTTRTYEGFGTGRPIRLVEEDARLLQTQIGEIAAISPEYSREASIRVGENIINTSIAGIIPIYSDMRNVIPARGGRFVDDLDMRDRRRVVVLGDEVKRLLYGESEVIGKLVYIDNVPFTVIGTMIKKIQNASYNRRDQDRVFIPASTFSSIYGSPYINNIIFVPKDPRRSEETIARVRTVLGKKYRFDPEDKDAVFIWDTAEFDTFIFNFFLAFNLFMGLIGSFTLAVGGIGVANIMYIVVQERVREIGIRRAVGARRSSIVVQFLGESLFIVALGSSIGWLIALGLTSLLQYVPIKDFVGTPEISWEVALATGSVLGLIALASGLFPARRAANLDVVECLRS